MVLRNATLDDLGIIMDWIEDKHACRLWAGPGFRFPFIWDNFLTDLGYLVHDTFAIVNTLDKPEGIGQIMHRDDRLHLARILINPDCRGKGYGRLLCQELIKVGKSRYKDKAFSLNVYRHNTVASRLYESLGFKISPDQQNVPDPDSVFMVYPD